jgi:hypothetical protein
MNVEKFYDTLAQIIAAREGLKINITVERREAPCHICARSIGTENVMAVGTVANLNHTTAPSVAKRF